MKQKYTGKIENFLDCFLLSDAYDREAGMSAFANYNRMMKRIAAAFGCTPEQAAAVFVSLSPSSDYLGNLRSAVTLIRAWKEGVSEDRVVVTSFGHCAKRAWKYLRGADFLKETKGKKIKSFYRSIVNPDDPEPVTVDGHVVNIWQGRRIPLKEVAANRFNYEAVASDLRTACAQTGGMLPNQFQGIIWHTWKRVHGIVYDANLDLFGDHWGLDRDPLEIKPFPYRPA